jgi:WD40 repeat protein
MSERRTERWRQRLYSQVPLIGIWLRREAVKALARDGSPRAVGALAEAVIRSRDEWVCSRALDALRQLASRDHVVAQEALCYLAIEHDHSLATRTAVAAGYAPRDLVRRALFYFLTGQRAEYERLDVDRDLLQTAYKTADERLQRRLAERAQQADSNTSAIALWQLAEQGCLAAKEALFRLVIECDHPSACEVAAAAQIAPSDPHRRALFFFLTEQWDKYRALDFDQTLLRAAYEAADEELQGRITEKARQAGRVGWVAVAIGGRQGRRLGEMVDAEWEAALAVLGGEERWEEMWWLAQAAPAGWSARLLQRLKGAGWSPQSEGERLGFTELVAFADKCLDHLPDELGITVRCQRVLEGHVDSVACLAISPDGQLLASGGGYKDYTVRLWRLPDGAALTTLGGHTGPIACLATSPDGRLLASGSWDETVRLWQLPEGLPLHTLEGHTGLISALTFIPNGGLLASGSVDETVQLWRLSGGRSLKTLREHETAISCLAVSPDGQLLASGSWDETVRLWRLPHGLPLKVLAGHTGSVECLAVSSDGRLLASGGEDKTVRLWQLPDGVPPETLEGYPGPVICLAISPNGRLLASGSGEPDCTVRLRRLPDGALLKALEGHSEPVRALAFSPGGWLLASASHDRTVRLWVSDLTRLGRIPVEQTSLEDIEWIQQMLQNTEISSAEQAWAEFLLALMRWRRRFDIEVAAAPVHIPAGEFDIEIEG